MLPGLPLVPITRTRYGAQTISTTTFLPSSTSTTTTHRATEVPWRSDAVARRPDGETSDNTRLFSAPVEFRGVRNQGESTAAKPDRITSPSGTWEVLEVVDAPAMPGIPRAYHAYCVRVRPGDAA